MQKAYLFPISSRGPIGIHNPYLNHFMDSLQDKYFFVNRNHPSGIGIADVMKYLGKIEVIFFHWPEDIVERQFGILQTLLLTLLLPILNFLKISIIYVVHNKLSHSEKKIRVKSYIAKKTIRHSNSLVTHAREGVDFINANSHKPKLVFFFPHPIDKTPAQLNIEKDIDVLIWGNIAPYKGIHNFLLTLQKNNNNNHHWKVFIAGKVSSREYSQELMRIKPGWVRLWDEFIDDRMIHELISRSRIVLFPYQQDSILSSGAFAKTLAYPVEIIGPNCGAFKDFGYLNYVNTFDSFDDIINLIPKILEHQNREKPLESEKISSQYSWANFGKAFSEFLQNS